MRKRSRGRHGHQRDQRARDETDPPAREHGADHPHPERSRAPRPRPAARARCDQRALDLGRAVVEGYDVVAGVAAVTPAPSPEREEQAHQQCHRRDPERDPHRPLRRPPQRHREAARRRLDQPTVGVAVDQGRPADVLAVDGGFPARVVALPEHEPEGRALLRAPDRTARSSMLPLLVTLTRGVAASGARRLRHRRRQLPPLAEPHRRAPGVGAEHETVDVDAGLVPAANAARGRRGRCPRRPSPATEHGCEVQRTTRGGVGRRTGERHGTASWPSSLRRPMRHTEGSAAGIGARCTPGRPTSASATGIAVGTRSW